MQRHSGCIAFASELDVRVALLVQFDVVVEHAVDGSVDDRPDGSLAFPTLPLLLLVGPFAFPRQGQFLVALLPH